VTSIIEANFKKEEIEFIFNLAKNLSELLDYVHNLEEVKQHAIKDEIF
jgi:hypothetical protein